MLEDPAAAVLHNEALPEFIRKGFAYDNHDEDANSQCQEDETESALEYDDDDEEVPAET